MYVSVYDLQHLTDISTNADVVIPAVHATVQPLNMALHKPAWSSTTFEAGPPRWGVDGDDGTVTAIYTTSTWSFLAVDLGGPVTVEKILMRMFRGDCQVWQSVETYGNSFVVGCSGLGGLFTKRHCLASIGLPIIQIRWSHGVSSL